MTDSVQVSHFCR